MYFLLRACRINNKVNIAANPSYYLFCLLALKKFSSSFHSRLNSFESRWNSYCCQFKDWSGTHHSLPSTCARCCWTGRTWTGPSCGRPRSCRGSEPAPCRCSGSAAWADRPRTRCGPARGSRGSTDAPLRGRKMGSGGSEGVMYNVFNVSGYNEIMLIDKLLSAFFLM